MTRQALKIIVLTLACVGGSFATHAAVGDIVASATSQNTWMDTVSCSNSTTVITVGKDAESVKISYSGRTWYTGTAMGTSALYDNEVLVQNFTGEGWYEYVPPTAESHTLSLRIANGPTYRRTFVVEGLTTPTIARGTNPAINGGIICTISSSVSGATIYFTTDGSEPTTESRVYTGPFAINPVMATPVKAFCVAEGWLRSQTAMNLLMSPENVEVAASADSEQTFMDTRAGTGTLEAKVIEPIAWSGLWSADTNADVTVTVHGEPFTAGKSDGVETWLPMAPGMYTFQHTTRPHGSGSAEVLFADFDVVVKDIALAQVAVDCSDVIYSGSAYTPAIQSATWGERELVAGMDYTLAYSGNVNVGTATITLTGINLFNGTYTTNFTINPKTLTSAMVGTAADVVYTGSAHKPEPTVTDEDLGVALVNGADYTLLWGENTAAGSGSVTVTGTGNYTGVITKEFSIDKATNIWVVEPSIADWIYGQAASVPNMGAAKFGSVGMEYSQLPLGIGNYTATFSVQGTDNYTGLTKVVPFRITSGDGPAQTRFRVEFDANGGELDAEVAEYDLGDYYGVLPTPFRAGYVFDGWYERADFSGSPVTRNTEVIAQDLTLHAKWLRRALWYTDAVFHLDDAAQYSGYLVDTAADDAIAGTITVKAGKPSKKTGASKLTVTVMVAGRKKAVLKGTTFDGTFQGAADGMPLDLRLGFSSMSGTFGRYAIDGALNVFAAKDADSKLVAAQALKKWQGSYMVAWPSPSSAGWNGLSVDVRAKGKAKVSGVLADGAKVSASSQLLVGERECAVAVSWTKKGASVACLLWFREDGSVECGNLPGGASAIVANLRGGAYLAPGAALGIDAGAMSEAIPGLLADLLPDGQAVRMDGMKFEVDKAGKVSAKGGVLDLSKAGTNPSGLKLKYTIKNGMFSGSFSAYALEGGKLRKYTVNVSGVMVGGVGYGTATCKKPAAAWPVVVQ